MRILSIAIAHDSSVCSINDGVIEFFCKEERLSRNKRDKAPFKSIQKYIEQNFGEIDEVLFHTPSNYYDDANFFYQLYLHKTFGKEPINFSSLSHHQCHASLAFYNSGFKEALVFVIDRNGSILFANGNSAARESESVYKCSYPNNFDPVYKSFFTVGNNAFNISDVKMYAKGCFPNTEIKITQNYGLVKVYEAATTLIGQSALENGKTMGLASYGEDDSYESLFDGDDVRFHKFSQVKVDFNGDLDTSCFAECEGLITKEITNKNYQFYANKAKQVQQQTQEQALKLIRKYVELTGVDKVCVVGGYGLNVVANDYYIRTLPNVQFYFEPLADDTGISIGAGMLKYRELSEDVSIITPKDNFYHWYEPTIINQGVSADIDDVCDKIISQHSVAIFDGNPEAGPRALGHRSILFDPRNIDSKNLINKVKNREWYRPFAGVVLEEDFDKYFHTNGLCKSEYMTINFSCKDGVVEQIPGVVHVDNTCRVQTVSSGFLYDLLKKFKEKTGCGVLLNTSFNLAGEPLVQTKQEALHVLTQSELDYVYFVDEHKLCGNEKDPS